MAVKHSLATALRMIRKARGLSQEAFSDVSSRTYLSTLERDMKSPTLNKLADLCEVMNVHPLTLLTLAFAGGSLEDSDQLLVQVRQELTAIIGDPPEPLPAVEQEVDV
ncbi:helix-turn-helix domain-containing protein [Pseudomonas aeruginosa]